MVEPSLREYLLDLYVRSLLLDVDCSYENYKYTVKDNKFVLVGFCDIDIVFKKLQKDMSLYIDPYFEVCDIECNYEEYYTKKQINLEFGDSFESIYNFQVGKSLFLLNIVANGVIKISKQEYMGNSNLISFKSTGIKIIEKSGFEYCTNLERIEFPNCEYVEKSGFCDCYRLNNVYLPSCKIVKDYAFSGDTINYLRVNKNCVLLPNACDDYSKINIIRG